MYDLYTWLISYFENIGQKSEITLFLKINKQASEKHYIPRDMYLDGLRK